MGSLGNQLAQVRVGVTEELPVATNPNWVEALAASAPFQDRFFTVTAEPLVVSVAFQTWLRDCPLARVQVTVQALMALAPAVTVTCPWKPSAQELLIWYAALHAVEGCVGTVVVGGGVDDGAVVGGVVAGVVAAGVADGYGALDARL